MNDTSHRRSANANIPSVWWPGTEAGLFIRSDGRGYIDNMTMLPPPADRGVITYAEFVETYAAIAFANCQGYKIDAALDVTWALHGIRTEAAVARAHYVLLKWIDGWLTKNSLPVLYFWAFEVGSTFGLHSHITLHLPKRSEAAFRAGLEVCLAWIGSGPLVTNSSARTYLLEVIDREVTDRQWSRFRYLMKGTDCLLDLNGVRANTGTPTLAVAARLDCKFEGYIDMPRVGVSSSIAQPARAAWAARVALPPMTISGSSPPTMNDTFLHWSEAHPDAFGRDKWRYPLPNPR